MVESGESELVLLMWYMKGGGTHLPGGVAAARELIWCGGCWAHAVLVGGECLYGSHRSREAPRATGGA